MAGSRTVMSGVFYSTTPLNVQNGTTAITGNTQAVTYNGISRMPLNGSVATFHNSNRIMNVHLIKPTGKIIVQGSSNGNVIVGPFSNNRVATLPKMENPLPCPTTSANELSTNFNNSILRESNHINHPQYVSESLVPQLHKEVKEEPEVIEEPDVPVIDIMINNVVCSFSVGCHLDLRNIALTGKNVEFRRENGMVTMKLRRPLTTASIWSSGKITCTGSTSEDEARIAARRIARALQKLGYTVKFRNYRVVNVLGTCTMPFAIKIAQFSQKYREAASYEPELHPGVTYKIVDPKATLKVFSTGSITVTAPCVANVQSAIEHIYPLVKEFSKERSPEELAEMHKKNNNKANSEYEESSNSDSDSDSD